MDENHGKKIKRVDEDLYDRLGEPLWSSILSLLPFDEAVRTSVLSRSWRYAWTNIPHLDLDIFNTTQRSVKEEDRDYWVPMNGEDDEWVQTVDKILLSHTGPIESCRIPTWYSISNLDVDRWIDILIQKSIGELIIESSDEFPYQLPASVFSCTTIKKFVLINCGLRLSPSASLGCKNLKTIQLNNTTIYIGTIECLLSQCSNLDSLTLDDCIFEEEPFLHINAPHLKCLTMSYIHAVGLKRVRIDAPLLKSLKLDDSVLRYEFEIHVPKLETFECHIQHQLMPTPDKYEILKVKGGKIITLLRSISHVKVIQLSGFTVMYLCWAIGHMNFPSFVNSKKLVIQVNLSERMGVFLLSKLLQNFPSLEELEFWSHNSITITKSTSLKKVSFNSRYWEKQQKHFHFLNSTLKRVVIEDLKGDIFTFYFSKFLIGSAKVLERMTVKYSCLAARKALKRQFSLGDVASSNVELSIVVKKSKG